jgi:hypothetical protein
MTHISQKAKLLTKEILKKKSEKKYGAKFSKTLLSTTFPYYCTKQSNFYTLSQARTTPSEHSKQHVL